MIPGEHALETGISVPTRRLSEVLLATIATLADAGDVEGACRFAGQACVALRRTDPGLARRFDVLLHRLSSKLNW